MKRPQCAVMIKDQEGTLSQHSIHATVKEAQKNARDLAIVKVRAGMQTDTHSDKTYIFPDGYRIFLRTVYADGTYYGKDENGKTVRVMHEFADPIFA